MSENIDHKGIVILKLKPGLLYNHQDLNYKTLIYGFTSKSKVILPKGYTHFGTVVQGKIKLKYQSTERLLQRGDFFSVVGPAKIDSINGLGMVSSSHNYKGFNIFGGPLEKTGRLKYIDGCTDSLLIPPLRKGDPCLNHLHFPINIKQTPHTHPSIRTGLVYRGTGQCIIPNDDLIIPLKKGFMFIIKPESVHSFNTGKNSMDVVAFHPDSDVGVTDEDHPMINRTIVDGKSAKFNKEIRTK